MDVAIRIAAPDDAAVVARLLHDFNSEYEEPTPSVETLTRFCRQLLEEEEMTALLAGEDPVALSVLRFRTSLWNGEPEAYLEELYVVPRLRGRGIGRALMEATMAAARERGATRIDLNTAETDTAARGLYERLGFTNREGGPEGPPMLYYEREL